MNAGCLLLNKLPLEIRLQIYEYVLGGNLIHLIQIPRRIAHVRCRASRVPDHLRECRPASRIPNHPWLRSVSSANLAFLKTCRQIYMEAISILYTTNTFDINQLSTFLFFSKSILSDRLRCITSLHLRWNLGSNFVHYGPKKNYQDWNSFWELLATQMPGLRHLRISLSCRSSMIPVPLSIAEPWVAPMCQVRRLRSVEIEIDEDLDEESVGGEGLAKQNEAQKLLVEFLQTVMLSTKEGVMVSKERTGLAS